MAVVKYLRARPAKLAEILDFGAIFFGIFGRFEERLRQFTFALFALFCFHKWSLQWGWAPIPGHK